MYISKYGLFLFEQIDPAKSAADDWNYRVVKSYIGWDDRVSAIKFIKKAFSLPDWGTDHLNRYDCCPLYGLNFPYDKLEIRKVQLPAKTQVVVLDNVQGIARKSGVDADGLSWIEFEVDYLAEQEDSECVFCGATINEGWTCLDGGDEICNSHVVYLEDLAQ